MPDPSTEKPLPVAVVPPKPGGPEVAAVGQPPRRFELPPEFSNEPKKPVAADPVSAPAGETPVPPAEGESATPPDAKSEDAPAGEPETKESKALTPEQRAQRRADRAYRKAAEERAQRLLLEQEIQKLRSSQVQTPAAESTSAAPKLEDFDDIEKYAKALADHTAKEAVEHDRKSRDVEAKKKQAEEVQAKQRQYIESLSTSWEEKSSRGEDKYADWAEKVGDLKPTSPFAVAIMEADNSDDIAYYLGSNPKEAARIAKLPPQSLFREIGKLEAKLSLQEKPPAKPSKAPAPIAPVSGAQAPVDDSWKPGDTFEKFLTTRNKELRRPPNAGLFGR